MGAKNISKSCACWKAALISEDKLILELGEMATAMRDVVPILAKDFKYLGQERELVHSIAEYVANQENRLLRVLSANGLTPTARLGLAKDSFVAPKNIDASNAEIENLFYGADKLPPPEGQ